jgi:hypothetical protein
MKVSISTSACAETHRSEEILERLLRIAFTRYASIIRQVTLVLEAKASPGLRPTYGVRLVVCFKQWPDVEIQEMQPRLELAIDRAIHRTDGVLRQYARQKAKRAS